MKTKNKINLVCIIPARGGSKSVKSKNTKILLGKPLIHYTLKTAKQSKIFDKIIVSSDCLHTKKIVNQYSGIEFYYRPKNISGDKAKTESALLHVCQTLEKKENFIPDYIYTLEPTSPFRKISTILKSKKIIEETDADSIIAIGETSKNFGKIKNNKFRFDSPNLNRRRQDRSNLYFESGTIYVTKYEILKKLKTVIGKSLYPIIVSEIETIDINNIYDFYLCESIMKNLKRMERLK
tara:strand:+ start:675 stop:1385 length:711 start_codon:yes stop_codon:yes gene_type:complete